MYRLRPRTSAPSALVIGTSAVVLFAAGVGIAVLVGGVDASPRWMRAMAVFLAMGLAGTFVTATAERAMHTGERMRAMGP